MEQRWRTYTLDHIQWHPPGTTTSKMGLAGQASCSSPLQLATPKKCIVPSKQTKTKKKNYCFCERTSKPKFLDGPALFLQLFPGTPSMKHYLLVVDLKEPFSSGMWGEHLEKQLHNVGSSFYFRNEHEIGGMESAHDNAIWSLSWHPIGHMLVSGSNDNTRYFSIQRNYPVFYSTVGFKVAGKKPHYQILNHTYIITKPLPPYQKKKKKKALSI